MWATARGKGHTGIRISRHWKDCAPHLGQFEACRALAQLQQSRAKGHVPAFPPVYACKHGHTLTLLAHCTKQTVRAEVEDRLFQSFQLQMESTPAVLSR